MPVRLKIVPSASEESVFEADKEGGRRRLGDIRAAKPHARSRSPIVIVARRASSIASLVLIDLSGLALGLYLALVVREFYVGHDRPLWGLLWTAESKWLPFLTLVTVLVFWQAGLYRPRELRAGFGRLLSSVVLVTVLTLAYAVGSGHHFRTFGLVPTAFLFTLLLIGAFRASYEALTATILHFLGVRRRALLVGQGDALAHLRKVLGETHGGIAYEFIGVVGPTEPLDGLPSAGSLDELPRLTSELDVDELLVANSDLSERQLLEVVEAAHRAGVHVRVAPTTAGILTQRGQYIPGHGIPLFELRPPVFVGTDFVVKRAFDVVVSAATMVIGLPVWGLIALAIKLDSPGPVLYRDRRVGVNEHEFDMFKFRTMRLDAFRHQPRLEAANEADGPLFKIREDPRVTRVGAVLRRFSLDEIPQTLNVLKGEMSLVGPRPLPIRDYHQLQPWHRKRYLVLPGMTGLWQISGRSTLGFDDLVRLDFYYLENWSLWLDISILLKTVPAVLARRGAY
jgi:exopolysaccharide biosynthesis polyprenyl glycosylphosphotransferase